MKSVPKKAVQIIQRTNVYFNASVLTMFVGEYVSERRCESIGTCGDAKVEFLRLSNAILYDVNRRVRSAFDDTNTREKGSYYRS